MLIVGNHYLLSNTEVDVYNAGGMLLRSKVKAGRCLEGLPKGIYIVNGKKIEK